MKCNICAKATPKNDSCREHNNHHELEEKKKLGFYTCEIAGRKHARCCKMQF